MATSQGPGDRIESRCTRCNDITGHVIVALVGGAIVKVECLACKSVHKYYPPVTEKAVREKKTVCRVKPGEDRKGAVSASRPMSKAMETKTALKARKVAEDLEQSWQRSLNLTSAAPKPYAMDGVFAKGDVVDHSIFGQGIVQSVQNDRMQLMFRDGVKLLKCGG